MPTNEKPKHAAGPWSWSPDDNAIEGGEDGVSTVCRITDHASTRTVRATGEHFSHADARLIAAAPEILEMLRSLQWREVDSRANLLFCASCDVTRAPDVAPNCFPGCKLAALLKRIDGDQP